MGTMMGNLLALVFIALAGLLGFMSLEISAYGFIAVSYGWWLWILIGHMAGGSMIGTTLKGSLTAD